MPTRPSKVISHCAFCGVASARVATARTRSASLAMWRAASRICVRPAIVERRSPSASQLRRAGIQNHFRSALGIRDDAVRRGCSVVIRLVSEAEGNFVDARELGVELRLFSPALAAAATSAPSVGSPLTCQFRRLRRRGRAGRRRPALQPVTSAPAARTVRCAVARELAPWLVAGARTLPRNRPAT